MGALFGFTGPAEPELLEQMSSALRHRGARLDHRATPFATLATQAPAPDSPFAISTGVVVQGGITLALAGYVTGTSTGCPSLVDVLERYRARGTAFVDELRGAWVLAVSDGARLLLARDGVGVRALYFGRHAGRLLFAVEPKGVLAAPGFPRRIRPAAVAEYFAMSFVPGRGTMLADVDELPAGHRAELQADGSFAVTRWFDFENVTAARASCSDDEWVARFRDELGRAVDERRPGRQSVAVFLSGGIDSSAVAAEVAARHDGPVRSYALHFGARYPSELPFARAAADAAGTTHHEVELRPRDFLPQLRRIVWHLDDPIGDPITAPNFALAAHVAPTTRWVWNGEGGDPVFGGPKNLPMLLHHWYGGIERDPLFRARAYLRSFRRGYEEVPRLLDPAWSTAACDRELERRVAELLDGHGPGSFLNKLCAANIRLKAGHLILPKVDRMLGAFGLVALSPFFDERLVRLSFEMPPSLKLARGIDKVILKRAFAGRLPEPIIARPKSGMRVPVHFWFKGELKKYARHILCRKELDRVGIFDAKRVEQLLAYEAEEADSRHGLLLWMLLTFEIWRRVVVEREAL